MCVRVFVLIYLLLGEGRCSKLRITEGTSLLGSEPNQDKRLSEGIKFKVLRTMLRDVVPSGLVSPPSLPGPEGLK